MKRIDSHPSIVDIEGMFLDGSNGYVVMRYVRGKRLNEVLQECYQQKDWNRIMRICRNLAMGVYHLHKYGIAHRDVKPENVIVREGSDQVVLIDFETSKQVNTRSGIYFIFKRMNG